MGRDRTVLDTSVVRPRVVEALRRGTGHPLTLVVGSAGSGKSTALRHLVEDVDGPSAWFRPDATCADPSRFLSGLLAALDPVAGIGTTRVADLAEARDRLRVDVASGAVLAVVDDLHTIRGSAAEAAMGALVRSAPPWLRIVAASREVPEFDLAELFLSGRAVQVPDDVLRWRPWEVERLFRDVYGDRLRPEDAARLCLRTEGWSAGLHLFHLASEGLGPVARRHLLTELDTTPAMVRDYLTRNVLAGLDADLVAFLLDTSVLGRLDADLCDRLRGCHDSAAALERLQSRRLFVVVREDGRGLRYHQVLRSYLEASLLERDGAVEVRRRFLRAGRLLESAGATADALHAYVRAEAWSTAETLLGRVGADVLSSGGHTLLDRLPDSFVQSDPWLLLARARTLMGRGGLRDAVAVYERAGRAFGRGSAGDAVRREARTAASWLTLANARHPIVDSSALLQQALRGDPRRAAARAAERGDTVGQLVAAAAELLAGDARAASRRARGAASAEAGDLLPLSLSRMLDGLAGAVAGDADRRRDLLEVADGLDRQGLGWVGRVVRAFAHVMGPPGSGQPDDGWRAIDATQDPWGRALLRLASGIASAVAGEPDACELQAVAEEFEGLGAPVLGVWARAWQALALADDTDGSGGPVELAQVGACDARDRARALLVPGAEALADLALSRLGDDAEALARATVLAEQLGMALPSVTLPGPVRVVERPAPPTIVRCFGGLGVVVAHRPVELSGLRPQVRVVLALLAMSAPAPVHRARLVGALWPGGDPDTNLRRLSVLVSTLRRHLEPHTPAGEWDLLVRLGEAHALRLPRDGWLDVRVFDDAVSAARSAQRIDPTSRRDLLQVAFDAYGGELLPEFGPAEWVLAERDHYRMAFTNVASSLARAELEHGDPGACVETARAGLRVDRYRSTLWSALAAGHRALGDTAAAARARRDHRLALLDLGVEPTGVADGRVGPHSLRRAELQVRE